MDEAASGEIAQVEYDCLDLLVGRGGPHGPDHVAGAVFVNRGGTGNQLLDGVDGARFLDDRAVQLEQQCALANLRDVGPRAQGAIERQEEQQHEKQDEPVLDGHQQLPDLASEDHRDP